MAAGGPDNVWILEVGDADRWGDFDRFRAAIAGSTVEVADHGWGDDGAHDGFTVRYRSPAEGVVDLDADGNLRIDDRPVSTSGYPRFANPFATVAGGDPVVAIADDTGTFTLDLAAGTRRPSPSI